MNPVDVLAVMLAGAHCPRMQPQIAKELGQARLCVAALIAAVEPLLTPDATIIAGDIRIPLAGSSVEAMEALIRARRALAECKGAGQ